MAGPHSLFNSVTADEPRRASLHSYPLAEDSHSYYEQLSADNSAADTMPSGSDRGTQQEGNEDTCPLTSSSHAVDGNGQVRISNTPT